MTTGGVFLVYDGSNIPTVTSTQISQVKSGHSYKYHVIAVNRVGNSDNSTFSQTMVAASVPGRPEPPRYVSSTSTSMTLEFDKVEDNGGSPISNYVMYVDKGDRNFVEVTLYNGQSLTWTITQTDEADLLTGELYLFKISAVNLIGEGESSNSFTIAMAQ